MAPSGKSRSEYVVSVYQPVPDAAVAAAIWRDSSGKPPNDAGLADYTLARENGEWKSVTSRDGYLPSPGSFIAAPLGVDWEPLFDGKTSQGWISVTGRAELPAARAD